MGTRSLVILTGLLGAAACAKLTGLDALTEVACLGEACADASADGATGPGPASPGDGAAPGAPGADTSSAVDASTADATAVDGAAVDGLTVDASPASCPGKQGPKQVRVGAFCIDATEVTNAQYGDFLAAAGDDLTKLPSACRWKRSLLPSNAWPVSPARRNHPVVFVDWCDAHAYCAWAGKRLCGAIAGGPSSRAAAANASTDQWYAACSANGTRAYPYGATYDSTACAEGGGTRPVAEAARCEGSAPGLFDMSGNVWEWEDACEGSVGPTDVCLLRGGSWWRGGAAYMACAEPYDEPILRAMSYNDLGIRCCAP